MSDALEMEWKKAQKSISNKIKTKQRREKKEKHHDDEKSAKEKLIVCVCEFAFCLSPLNVFCVPFSFHIAHLFR